MELLLDGKALVVLEVEAEIPDEWEVVMLSLDWAWPSVEPFRPLRLFYRNCSIMSL